LFQVAGARVFPSAFTPHLFPAFGPFLVICVAAFPLHCWSLIAMTSNFHSTFGNQRAATTEEATNRKPRSHRRRRGRGRGVNRGGGDSAVFDAGPASRTTKSAGIHIAHSSQQTFGSRGASASGDPLHVLASEDARAVTQDLGIEPSPPQLQVATTSRFHSTSGDELAATTEEATSSQRRSPTGGRRRRGGCRAVHGGEGDRSVVDAGPASRVMQSAGIHTVDTNPQAAQNRDASVWGEPLHTLAAEEAQSLAPALGMGGNPHELQGGARGGGGGGRGGGGSGPNPGFASELGRVMGERVAILAEREELRGTMSQISDLIQSLQAENDRLNRQNEEMTRMIRNNFASGGLGASMLGRFLEECRPVTQPAPAEYENQAFPPQFLRLHDALQTLAQGENEDTLTGTSGAVQRREVGGASDREATEANGFARNDFQSLVVRLAEEGREHNSWETLRSVRDSLVRLGESTVELAEPLSAGGAPRMGLPVAIERHTQIASKSHLAARAA